MATLANLVVRLTGDSSSVNRALSKTDKRLMQTADRMGAVGMKMTKGITLPVVAGAAASVKAFADFDDKMTQSTAIMGDLDDQMRSTMEKTARDVAKTTKVSATEAAESYFFLASAGLDAEQSVGALPQVAKFAQAGMFDMATATDLATDAQSALGLASDDAEQNLKNLTRTTDVFTKANELANTSVEQVAEAMTRKAGARLKSLGKDIEEGTAVLAAFADQGLKGVEAGTALDIVLRELERQSLANEQAFKDAGVAVFDAQGEMRNTADIVADLEGSLVGLSDAEKAARLEQMGFTAESQSFIKALLGTSDNIRSYEKDLRGAAGTTERVADEQMKSFTAQMGLVKDEVIDAGISLGETLAPTLLKIAKGFAAVVRFITNLPGPLKGVLLGLVGIAAAAGPVLVVAAKLIKAFQFVRTALMAVRVASLATIGVWGLIIAAVVILVIVIVKNWDTIWSVTKAVFGAIKDFLMAVGGAIFDFLKATWEGIQAVTRAVFDGIKAYFTFVFNLYQSIIEGVWNTIKAVTSAVWNTIAAIVRGAIETVGRWIDTGKAAIQGLIDIFHAVKSAVATAFDFVKRKVTGVIDRIMGPIRSVGGAISKLPFIGSSPIPMVEDMKKTASEADRMARVFERVQQRGFGGFDGATMPPGLRMQGQGGSKQEKHFHLHVNGEGPTGPTLTGFRMLQALEER